tara:strand:- start:7 stop:162 length:156 start_codon:yes stop_codon:yes gene_type:complete
MNTVDINKVHLLETEIDILQRKADAEKGGMGHLYTAIEVLRHRVRELKGDK